MEIFVQRVVGMGSWEQLLRGSEGSGQKVTVNCSAVMMKVSADPVGNCGNGIPFRVVPNLHGGLGLPSLYRPAIRCGPLLERGMPLGTAAPFG